MPAIVRELLRAADHCQAHDRLRLAVTEQEWHEIREYCFERDHRFMGKIRSLPLVVCAHPALSFVEFAPEVMPHA